MTSAKSPWKTEEVQSVIELADKFVARELLPNREKWEEQHYVDRTAWLKAGELGLLCCSVPEEYGGGGGSIAYDLAVCEVLGRAGEYGWGNLVHSGIVAHYILAYGSEEQKSRWLPKMSSGEMIGAIAMTEPGTGSDLKAVRTSAVIEDDHYVINGSKTFISNGATADLIVVVVKTGPELGARGISLIVVETADCPGFTRGRILDKVGQHAADTSELHFDQVRAPMENLLGSAEGLGFGQLMAQLPQERLLVAATAVAVMETAVEHTITYVKQRQAFGQAIFDFQNTRFVLAECSTTARIARAFFDDCVGRHLAGALDDATAAMAKWWLTDQQVTVVDRCLQLYGGYGYMREYAIARMYEDARIQKIYGGSNEIMKEIIAKAL